MFPLSKNENKEWFDQFFNSCFNSYFGSSKTIEQAKFNVYQKNGCYVVSTPVSGLSIEDVNVEVAEEGAIHVLTISYKTSYDTEIEDSKVFRREYQNYSMMQSFSLPKDADPESIKAEITKGELIVTIPIVKEKIEPLKRKIDIFVKG